MGFTLHKGNFTKNDFYQIGLLDSLFYDEKYLLKAEDYETRYSVNKNSLYVIRDNKNIIIGYFSILPLTYEAYTRIKNGEIDKDVITKDNIITDNESGEYFYWDSILIHPKFRNYGLGSKVVKFGLNNIIQTQPKIKRILAHAISKGGVKVTKKYGLLHKKNIDKKVIVLERAFQKKVPRKRNYKDKNKIELQKERKARNYYLKRHN